MAEDVPNLPPVEPDPDKPDDELGVQDVLSQQERKFVEVLLETGNASEAARQAGYNWPGSTAPKLLKKAAIQAVLKEAKTAWQSACEDVLSRLAAIAWVNIADFCDENGVPEWGRIKRRGKLVKEYKATVLRTMDNGDKLVSCKIVLHDSHEALRDMARINKMLAPDSSETIEALVALITRAADAELPQELAGRLLRRVSEDAKTFRN